MKFNIKQTDYYGNVCTDGKWWSWDETCDRCGTDCQHSDVITTEKPNVDEADFCIRCCRELMDQGVPYEAAHKMYKKG